MQIVFKPMGVALLIVAMTIVIGVVLLQQQQLSKARQSLTAPLAPKAVRAADTSALREGVYRIQSVSSGLNLGTHNSSADPKVEGHISQGPWNGTPNQKWRLLRMIDGTFNIQNTHHGFWLDNTNASMATGDFVRQWYEVTRTTNDAQKWQLIGQGAGNYQIRNVMSGKVLEIHDDSQKPGAFVFQEEWKGVDSQKFAFKRLAN